MRSRSELQAHIKNTNSQSSLPEITENLRTGQGIDEMQNRFSDASVQQSIDLDFIEYFDKNLDKVEQYIQKHAKVNDHHSLMMLRTVPGIGIMLSLVILYDRNDIVRLTTVQDFASYSRLVKCRKESAGKLYGTTGRKIGNAYLKWAFSEAAVLNLPGNPLAKEGLQQMMMKRNKARALTILSHKLGKAVYFPL